MVLDAKYTENDHYDPQENIIKPSLFVGFKVAFY